MNSRHFHVNGLRLFLPILLGILFSMGDLVTANKGKIDISSPALFLHAIVFSAIFIALFSLLDIALSRILAVSESEAGKPACTKHDKNRKESVSEPSVSHFSQNIKDLFGAPKKATLILWAFIFVCWLPYLVALYPGVYWADTSSQLIQYYGGAPLTDHHPLLDTFLFGSFSDFGYTLFSSKSAGLFILICIQAISAARLFASLIMRTHRRGIHDYVCFGTALFVALFPFFPIMFSSLAKDTISALFFMGFFLQIEEAVYSRGESLSSVSGLSSVVVTAILLSLTKKTMAYVATPSLLALALIAYKGRKRFALSAACITGITVFYLYPSILLPYLNVAPGGKQEAIAVPIQQIAHDVTYNDENITSEEREIIDSVLACKYEDIPALYNYEIVDAIKGRSIENEDLLPNFIKLWVKKNFEHPLGHLEAWLGLTHGWLSFRNDDGSANYMVVLTESLWYEEPILDYFDWPTSDSLNLAIRRFYDFCQSIPVLNVLFYRSTWATILPFALVYIAIGKRQDTLRSLVYLSPIILATISLALVPVSGMGGEPTRYVFQCVCVIPFALFQLPKIRNCQQTSLNLAAE